MAILLDDYFAFETGDGSTLTEDRWGEIFSWMRTNGILSINVPLDTSSDFAVNPATSPVGTQVQVENGETIINGYFGKLSSGPSVIDITANSSGDPRIDIVTLQLDKTNDNISIVVEEGTPDPSPVPPDLIQTSTVWQIALAYVTVADGATEIDSGDISDQRTRSVQGDSGSSAVTLTNAGSGSTLVNDNTGPSLSVKSLTASTNINFTVSDTDITIAGANTPSNQPFCMVRRNSNQAVNNGVTATITWSTAVYDPYSMWDGSTTITIPETGWYLVTVNIRWSGSVSANGSLICYALGSSGLATALSSVMVVGFEAVSNNFSVLTSLSATDTVAVQVTNSSGVNLNVITAGIYTPTLSVMKVRS